MIQAEYRRELNHSYMVIQNSILQLTQQYSYRMLRENRIRRLLSCQERMVDGKSCLYFEISSRQSLERFFEGKKLDAMQIWQILEQTMQVLEDMGEYLLDGESLILDPSCIFLDVETEEMYFCYCPGWGKGENPYTALADFFLEHADYSRETAVNLAYQFYKLSKSDSFVLASFLACIEKKNIRTQQKEWEKTPQSDEDRQWEVPPEPVLTECFETESEMGAKEERRRKRNWLQRLFGPKEKKKTQIFSKQKQTPGTEDNRTLWDVYADALEKREAGETIYFSDLEKPRSKPSGVPYLTEVKGKRRFSLEMLPVTVGKMADRAEIVLDDASVSRVHARFFSDGGEDLLLIDLNSRNGTMINDRKLAPNEAAKVELGDKIRFGRECFELAFIDSIGE
ncbi:MAG: FHA domain-containing protein [Lachnospiraceae bacterium]|nr:FHA domain-containing protein [Lachnospiraceae bacterium]